MMRHRSSTGSAKVAIYRDRFGIPHVVGESEEATFYGFGYAQACLLYTSPSPRDRTRSRMPSSA